VSAERDTIYFVSDAHFGLNAGAHGANEREKATRFRELAAEMRTRAASLYILGDLFDFWIEYRMAIRPDYFPVLHELRGLVEAGVRVQYLTGNHDFALGPFLQKIVGVSVSHYALDVELQGRRVHMRHGDDVLKENPLAAVLRNRFCQKLYRAIHPNIGIRLGMYFSAMSRKKHDSVEISEEAREKYRQAARSCMNAQKCDLVIYAHTHHAELMNYREGEYCNIGSWMKHYDYAVMRGGKIQLMRWGSSL
jgi:UDP-2,3-diacylglucosamine hydrolase